MSALDQSDWSAHLLASRAAEQAGILRVAVAHKKRLLDLNEARKEKNDDREHFPYILYPWSQRETLSRSVNDNLSYFEDLVEPFSHTISIGSRGIFAVRDIEKDEVITVEKPIVSARLDAECQAEIIS